MIVVSPEQIKVVKPLTLSNSPPTSSKLFCDDMTAFNDYLYQQQANQKQNRLLTEKEDEIDHTSLTFFSGKRGNCITSANECSSNVQYG
jgi:hypothetical protein